MAMAMAMAMAASKAFASIATGSQFFSNPGQLLLPFGNKKSTKEFFFKLRWWNKTLPVALSSHGGGGGVRVGVMQVVVNHVAGTL